MYLVLSSSLHPNSRSRILARRCIEQLQQQQQPCQLFDLAETPLPMCDGATAYGDENVQQLSALIERSSAILVASPVYNYDVSSAAKNAVELTGQAWTGKVVSMLLAAGGHGSYMSAMGLANSLMLDFRCLIIPRFVYATGDAFTDDELADDEIRQRVDVLISDTVRVAEALNS